MECHTCGSRDIDFSESLGHSACVNCGTIVEENTIVSSIEFQETGDRSHVIGQYVSATCSKPYNAAVRARGRYGNSRESRDTTLAQARRIIAQVANQLRLPSGYIDRAYRLYQMALDKKFVFGRRQVTVVATCLYTVCRQEKSPHLLIDFSDALQVNVFLLGSSFLRFIRMLNMDVDLPTVDPALYIYRFATRLEVGDKLNSIITMALRLVTRLKKDWICTGRRPDGICAAAMLIATRAHGFHKSQGEIAKIFRVSTDTLKNRLDDFKATPSAHLTIEQFNNNDATTEYDPPSYIKKLLSEVSDESNCTINVQLPGASNDESGDDDDDQNEMNDDRDDEKQVRFQKTVIGNVEINFPCPDFKDKKAKVSEKKQARNKEREQLYGTLYVDLGNSINPDDDETRTKLLNEALNAKDKKSLGGWGSKKSRIDENHTEVSVVVSSNKSNSSTKAQEVDLQIEELENLQKATNEKDNQDMTEILLDDDLDNYLLTDEEQRKKSVIWERSYRNFVDERQRKRVEREIEDNQPDDNGNVKMRKKYARKDGNKVPSSMDQEESKRTSKKINYDALHAAVFDGQGNFYLPDSTDAKNAAITNNILINTKQSKPKVTKKPASASKNTYVVENIDDYEEEDDEDVEINTNTKNFNNEDHIEYFDDNDHDDDDDYDDYDD